MLVDPLKTPLNWRTRLQIANEVVVALEYLFLFSDPPAYHVSISSSNIMLDENFAAKQKGSGNVGQLLDLNHASLLKGVAVTTGSQATGQTSLGAPNILQGSLQQVQNQNQHLLRSLDMKSDMNPMVRPQAVISDGSFVGGHGTAYTLAPVMGEELKKMIGVITYIQCSSKTQQNVKIVFDSAIKVALRPQKPKKKPRKRRTCFFF
ncbi:hypothetical protein HN51_040578 [Arachis hypogaea]